MDKRYKLALVGATGVVGEVARKVLEEKKLPISEYVFFSSCRSAGKKLTFMEKEYIVRELKEDSFDEGFDFAIFSAGGDTSKKFAPIAASKGCIVVDNSSAWRMDENVPLIVPEVNSSEIKNHKGIVIIILFCMVGIISPALAKLTPWFIEIFSRDLAETGISIGQIQVDAVTSWTQYFKNMTMMLIVFVVMFSNILVSEYERGTLVILVSKGLKRKNILLSKMSVLVLFWTIGCLLSFLITYIYTDYFWDNALIAQLFFTMFCFYFLGLYLCSLILLASVMTRSLSMVILFTGLCFFGFYLLGLFPQLTMYVPASLLNYATLLMMPQIEIGYYYPVIITFMLIVVHLIVSLFLFRKTRL